MRFLLLLSLFFSCVSMATAPPIQLATTFHEDIHIENYWISEKLDGVRAYWDGKQLLSRQGHPFQAPSWFTADYPEQPLDGELWIARGKFEQVSGVVRTQGGNAQAWRAVSFMLFDLPSSPDTFTQRLHQLQQLVDASTSPYLKLIPQYKLANQQALQAALNKVIEGGGEGLMLHHQDAYYQVKRSQDLMKLKRYEDAEAVVIEHLPGQGKYLGKMGALRVRMEDGLVFKIGTGFSDAERADPPKVGDTITFQYVGKTKNGVPRFASYLRIRFHASTSQ